MDGDVVVAKRNRCLSPLTRQVSPAACSCCGVDGRGHGLSTAVCAVDRGTAAVRFFLHFLNVLDVIARYTTYDDFFRGISEPRELIYMY